MILMIACWNCWWFLHRKARNDVIKLCIYVIITYQQKNIFFLSVDVIITNVIINCLQRAKLIIYFFYVTLFLLKSGWNLSYKKNIFLRQCQNFLQRIGFFSFANYFINFYLHPFHKLSTVHSLRSLHSSCFLLYGIFIRSTHV